MRFSASFLGETEQADSSGEIGLVEEGVNSVQDGVIVVNGISD